MLRPQRGTAFLFSGKASRGLPAALHFCSAFFIFFLLFSLKMYYTVRIGFFTKEYIQQC